MKKKLISMLATISIITTFVACGQDTAIIEFKNEIDNFCTAISEIDTSINSIDATSESAIRLLLGYLDDLNTAFQDFAELDFPEEFDYLESVADDAGNYMNEAVKSYKEVYSNGYNENLDTYAKENYSRAYKRIQVIISCLKGEEPTTDL